MRVEQIVGDGRSVSLAGVVVLAAVAVGLAATTGAVALDLGSDQTAPPRATA